jgi:hypothetical protein
LVGESSTKKAVLTLRIVRGYGSKGCRVVPFVFLPNLTEEATDKLENEVLCQIGDLEYNIWFQELKRIEGKRSYNELLTMIFSHVILQEFNEENGFRIKQEENVEELIKLARNYNLYGLEKTTQLLDELLHKKLFTLREMSDLFQRDIPESFKVLDVSDSSSPSSMRDIRTRLEDYLYQRGYEEEKEAIALSQTFDLGVSNRAKRKARGCCFMLVELNQGYTQQDVEDSMAYFLQMMDAGVLGLSSYAPDNVRVVGMAQYAKAGEMALYIRPLQYYKYMPLLANMQYECEQWGRPLQAEVKKYWERFSSTLNIEEREIQDLLDTLAEIRQTPKDWEGNYLFRIDADANIKDETEAAEWKMGYINEQSKLLERYTG